MVLAKHQKYPGAKPLDIGFLYAMGRIGVGRGAVIIVIMEIINIYYLILVFISYGENISYVFVFNFDLVTLGF